MKVEHLGRTLSFRRAGRGPGVLLLHAFPFSRTMWEAAMDALAPDHLVVALDFPGFGGSEAAPEEEASVALYAAAAEAVAARAGPEVEWCALGLSMGGYVAFELVRRARLRLRALVLADTKAEADSPAAREARFRRIEEVRARGAAAVAEASLAQMVTAACPAEVRARVDRWMRSARPDGLVGALRALAGRPDSTATLASVGVPALAIAGAEDPITPPADLERIARGIAGAELVTIPGAAHLSCVEQPQRFHDAVRAFLARVEA